ncbi:HET-E1 [Symbiodinium microadriaticum]|nr:HET-E1 [Symbiodinium microadriaticum]
MQSWEAAELATTSWSGVADTWSRHASWPGAVAPVSLLRPAPPRAPIVRPLEARCTAPPLVLPAAKTLESPTHSSQGSTGLGLSEGEDDGEDLPQAGIESARPALDQMQLKPELLPAFLDGNAMGGVTSFLNQDARREVPDPTFEHIAQFVPKWEWQGDGGTYVPYDAKLALKLEKAFSKLQEASASMVELSASVTVDLTQMREVAKSGEITRRIRRKTLDEVARGLAEPTWLHQDGEVLLADVPAEHLEATLVHETFFREGGLDAQEWAVVAIQRVQNYPLREAYHFERQQMLRELRRRTTEGSPEEEGKPDLELKEVWKGGEAALLGELQERLLAHGTRTCDPTVIVQDRDGFMAEKGAERAFYGQGCYFAEFVQYAHHYSHVVAGNTATRQLVLADVLCGRAYDMGEQLDRSGARCNRAWLRSNGYDSVVGGPHTPAKSGRGPNESRLFVMYRANQTYPRFVVTYKRITASKLIRSPARMKTTGSQSSQTPRQTPRASGPRFVPADVKVSQHGGPLLCVSWLSGQLCLATAGHVIRIDGQQTQRTALPHSAECAAFGPSGSVALWLKSRRLLLGGPQDDLSEAALEHPWTAQVVAWSPDEAEVATGSKDGKVRMFSVSTRTVRETFAHSCPVLCLAWNPERPKMALGGSDGKLCVLATDTMTIELTLEMTNWLTSLAWSSCGERLAVGCDDRKLHVLRGGCAECAVEHEDRIWASMFHPEFTHVVATGAVDGKVRIVNTTTSTAESVSRGNEVVTSAAWNPAGDALAVGGDGGTLRIISFQAQKIQSSSKVHGGFNGKVDAHMFALDEAFDAPKTGGYVAVPGFERFGSPKDKNVMPVLAKDEGVKVLDKSTPEVTFGLNVSPVLLSVLDQMAKEVEERGGLPFRQQTI